MTAPINIVSLAGNVPTLSLDVPGIAHQPKANSQRPPGSYAERPLGQIAGALRFHSSLEGITDNWTGRFEQGRRSVPAVLRETTGRPRIARRESGASIRSAMWSSFPNVGG